MDEAKGKEVEGRVPSRLIPSFFYVITIKRVGLACD